MKASGWILFSVGLLVFIWKGIALFIMFVGGIGHYLPTEIIGAIFVVCIGIILTSVGWMLSHRKSKQLICPNGCNITQAGSKFCGQCGSKLIMK